MQAQGEEVVLSQYLEHIIPDVFGQRPAIVAIDRRRSQFATCYDSCILTVQLADGEEMKVFLKDFGSYNHVKEQMEEKRKRELRVYHELLADADLGTARYYGSAWDESQKRFWLFLEFVSGVPVKYCEFSHWLAAARWLARMHAYYAQRIDRLNECSFLARHDRHFFQSTAVRAMRSISQCSPHFADSLSAIVSQYDRLVEVILRYPITFVHGDYRTRQILADTSVTPARICPVDWEEAGIGSGLYDLAGLAGGFDLQRRDEILRAYRAEAIDHNLSVPDLDGMKYAVDCFRLHRRVKFLSTAFDHGYSEDVIANLMGGAVQLASGLAKQIR